MKSDTPKNNTTPEPQLEKNRKNPYNVEEKSIKRFITASYIIAPVSLFIGGLLLSLVGVICAIVARVKYKKAEAIISTNLKTWFDRNTISVLIFTIAAFAINAAMFIFIISKLLTLIQSGDMQSLTSLVQSGDFSSLLQSGSVSSSTGSTTSSTWG